MQIIKTIIKTYDFEVKSEGTFYCCGASWLMKLFFFIFINICLLVNATFANQCDFYLKVPTASHIISEAIIESISSTTKSNKASNATVSAYTLAHQNYVFPPEAQFFTFEYLLRIAVHEAFEGLDYYSGQPLDFLNMSIDHVLPRALGGPDNVYNYAPTNPITNSLKGHKFTFDDLQVLEEIKNTYAPRVLALLNSYGAFQNRELHLERAIKVNEKRRQYNSSKKRQTEILLADIPIRGMDSNRVTVFRRTLDVPTYTMANLLLHFSRLISELDEKQIQELLKNRSFDFKMKVTESTKLKSEESLQYNIGLSFRRVGRKISEDALAVETRLFEVSNYSLNRRSNIADVTVEFHPMFALMLLELPGDPNLAEDYIHTIFKPSDIKPEEFKDWTNDR